MIYGSRELWFIDFNHVHVHCIRNEIGMGWGGIFHSYMYMYIQLRLLE